MKAFIYLYVLTQAITFLLYAWDKLRAKRQGTRIAERVLLLMAGVAPSGALLGMYLFRHKTRHLRFKIVTSLALIAHLALWMLYRTIT